LRFLSKNQFKIIQALKTNINWLGKTYRILAEQQLMEYEFQKQVIKKIVELEWLNNNDKISILDILRIRYYAL
jgi:hypothetical protein